MASAWSQQELEGLRERLAELGTTGDSTAKGAETPEAAQAEDRAALDRALAAFADEVKTRDAAAPEMVLAAPTADGAKPVADAAATSDGLKLASLEGLFLALAGAAPAQVAALLGRVADVFGGIGSALLRRALQDKLLAWFDATARALHAERPAALEAFVVAVAEGLRGTAILAEHPLGQVVDEALAARRTAEAAARKAEAEGAADGARTIADQIVGKIEKRLDRATRIVASRLLGAEVDARSQSFCARFDNRVLGSNLALLDRFETAIKLPEKFFDFDERFKIAASIFPGGIAGTDGADALDGLGKFAWILGADVAPKEGYGSLLSEEEALAFAEAQTRYVEDEFPMGGGVLGNLGAFASPVALSGIDLSSLKDISRLAVAHAAPKLSGAALRGRSVAGDILGRVSALTRGAAGPASLAAALPPAAVSAIRARDVKALDLALGGKVPEARLRELMSLGSIPGALRSAGGAAHGVGALSHLAMGFQSVAGAAAHESALRSVERLSFGGMGMRNGPASFGYVASPSTSYVTTLPLARLQATGALASGPAPTLGEFSAVALAQSLLPAARRSLGVGTTALAAGPSALEGAALALSAAGAPRTARLRAQTRIERQAAYAGAPALESAAYAAPAPAAFRASALAQATVPAFAIASDSFGVPRYRGAQPIPLAAVQVSGMDLSGTVVAGPRTSAPPALVPDVRTEGVMIRPPAGIIQEVAPGVRVSGLENVAHVMPLPAPSVERLASGARHAYTRDDYGIVRIQSMGAAGSMRMPASADMGGVDLARAGVTFSALDLAGGVAATDVGRNIPWMERLQAGGGLSASSVLGAETLRAALRDQAGTARPLSLGPVELSFPAGMEVPSLGAVVEAPLAAPVAGPVSPAVARRVSRALSGAAAPSVRPARRARAVRTSGRFIAPAAIPAHQAAESAYVAATSIRYGAAPSRSLLGALPGDLALPSGVEAARPQLLEKYYAAAASPRLALGGIGSFSLPSFGPAPRASLVGAGAATPVAAAGYDFAPASLARLTGVTLGAAAPLPGVRFDLPEGATAVPSFDASGFAPAARIGQAATLAGARAGLADDRYGRIGRDVQTLRALYSGAKLWSGGLDVASPEMVELKLAAAAEAGAIGDVGAGALLEARRGGEAALGGYLPPSFAGVSPETRVPLAIRTAGGRTVALEVPASELHAAAAPSTGAPSRGAAGWRAVRPSSPRLQGVYGAPAAAGEAGADVLGLSGMGGFEAAHAPSLVSPRLATLGLDAELASTIDRISAGAKPIDPLAAKALAPLAGEDVEHLRIARGPAVDAMAERLGTPAFAAGDVVGLGRGVDLSTREGMAVLAHEARHARAPRAPVHRFVDKLGAPGEADARAAGQAAAHLLPPAAGEGKVFGLVPKSVRGRTSDRFALDGWTEGDIRYSAGRLDAGVKLRDAQRGLDLAVDHEFVRFSGDITRLPAAALPVDLTSQLSGRTELQARAPSGAGLAFSTRDVELPLKAVFWGRKGGDRVARGGLEVREVALPSRFKAVDPRRIEGALALEAAEGVVPASYMLDRGVRPAGAEIATVAPPAPFAEAPARGVRQVPSTVKLDAKDVKIGGRFEETSTTVRASGEFAADLIESKSFRETVAPTGAEVLPKNAEFLAAAGVDAEAAARLVERNRDVASGVRAGYVRRGGLPNASDWALSLRFGGAPAAEAAPAEAGALALSFKRAGGPSEETVPAESAVGRKIRGSQGQPLSSPVLDFMERFFKRDLSGVKVHEGPQAREANRELGSEAFSTGGEVYVGTPRSSEDRLAVLGHEIAHALESEARRRAPASAPRRGAEPAPAARPAASAPSAQERRARDAERQIAAALRKEPRERRAPKLPMTHTRVSSKQAEAEDHRSPIQKKKSADTAIQMFEKSGQVLPKPWEALFPRPPKRDLTPLVYQIWNKIKWNLQIEMERRSGGF